MSSTARDTLNARVAARLQRRRRTQRLIKRMGLLAILLGISVIGLLFASALLHGFSGFMQAQIRLEIAPGRDLVGLLDGTADPDAVAFRALRQHFPGVESRTDRRALRQLLSIDAGNQLAGYLLKHGHSPGEPVRLRVAASSSVDMFLKNRWRGNVESVQCCLDDRQLGWVEALVDDGALSLHFNTAFWSNGDSREAELAGIRGAIAGSLLMIAVTFVLAFPAGVAAAIYLEEFAVKGRLADLIEITVNNLAAVPTVVFGLLGLVVFIEWFGMPRSAPLVGGTVLALLTLPVVIIGARASIRAVPRSIREAALALGASRMQMIAHHVLPQAMPGILTGTIIGLGRALGESAPLLLIGMVAFIADVPAAVTDPATALPVQIYLWSASPEQAFVEKTAAAVVVLMLFLLLMNLAAIALRNRLDRR